MGVSRESMPTITLVERGVLVQEALDLDKGRV